MMQIALCDDDQTSLNFLEEKIIGYAKEKKMHLYVDKFNCAKELRKQIEAGEIYQIYFLDMIMPEINGVELAEDIRKKDQKAIIIYLTFFMDYAFYAFRVFAQRYLLKPMKQKEFEEAMDFAVNQMTEKKKIFSVNTSKGIQRILYDDIEYIESISRTLQISVTRGEMIVSRFLRNSFEDDMEELLKNRNFIQVHKSFIVNVSHVKIYHRNQMVIQKKKIIPISKSKQTEVKRFYLKYISDEE